MAAIILTPTDPNEIFTPLTCSGTEDTITVNLPTNGRTNRRLQLVADGGSISIGFIAGGIAADKLVPVSSGSSAVVATQKQSTVIYVLGAAGVKVRPWVID